jgi:uncharacterized protein involved in exopolysaccharide biosynthesis
MENSVDTQSPMSRPGGSSGETIDVERLIAAFRRRLWLFLAVAAVIAAALLFVMLRQTPLYTATANIMINTRTEKVVESQAVLSGLTADTSVVDTEVEVLKSPQLAERIVNDLKLDQDPEFNPALAPPGLIGGLLSGAKASAPRAPGAAEAEKQAVIAAVGKQLSIRRVGLTYSITISFKSTSAAKAAKIANAFADGYIQSQLTAKFDATHQANSFLNSRLDSLRTQVQEADAAVSNYRVANNLLSSEGTTLTEQACSDPRSAGRGRGAPADRPGPNGRRIERRRRRRGPQLAGHPKPARPTRRRQRTGRRHVQPLWRPPPRHAASATRTGRHRSTDSGRNSPHRLQP